MSFATYAQEQNVSQMPQEAASVLTLVETQADLNAINKQLAKIETILQKDDVSIAKTVNYTKALNAVQDYAISKRSAWESDLNTAQQQIAALGEVPADGKEPADIAKKRKEFTKTADTHKSRIAEAELMIARVDTLNTRILNLRNTSLWNTLKTREESIIHPKTFWVSLVGFTTFMFDILKSPWTWYYSLTPDEQRSIVTQASKAGMTMCFALFIAIFCNVYIRKRFGYKASSENPSYTQKVSAAIWLFIARGLLPAGVLGAFIFWVRNTPLLNGTAFGTFLQVAASCILAIFLLKASVRSIFTPKRGFRWRLIDMSDVQAKSLSRTLSISIILICFVSFLQSMARRTDMTLEMEYAVQIIANLVKAACVILVSTRFLYTADQENKADTEEENLTLSSKIGTLITLMMSATFVLSLFGYIRLSEFILNRFISSVIFGGALFIIYRLIKVVLHQLLGLKYWTKNLHMTRKIMGKVEFWIGFLIAPIFLFVGTLFLLGIWGVSVDILMQSAKKFLTGFYIGGMKISLVSIFMGIIAFLVSLFVFKMIKN